MLSREAPTVNGSRVFLSHSGADTQDAWNLAETLRHNGLTVWFDKDSLQPGERWMEALELAINNSDAMVVYLGRLGLHAWVDREVRLGLERNTRAPNDFKLIPAFGNGCSGPTALPPFLTQHQSIDLRDRNRAPDEIRRLINVLKTSAERSAVPLDYWEKNSPFRSLRVFNPEDAWLFFGRDDETSQLLSLLEKQPVVAVLGNSGSGKSSLIRAGLIPALQRGRFQASGSAVNSWKMAVFSPTAAPFHALAEALPALMTDPDPTDIEETVSRWKHTLGSDTEALRNAIVALRTTAKEPWPADTRVLLFADQFEEIFTLTSDKEKRKRYIDALLAATRLGADPQVHLVLAMRADFYSYCLDHPDLSRLLQTSLYNVALMDREQLRAAIEKPLALAGTRAETGLIDSLLADVGTEPGNLALLEHALGQLWEKHNRGSSMLSTDIYSKIGRLRGALGKHADSVYADLGGDNKQRLSRRVFLDLVQLGEGAQDTRRRIAKETLYRFGDRQLLEQVLAGLASARLIATGSKGPNNPGESIVEISHEALIREWPRLRAWLDESRADLRLERRFGENALDWERVHRDPGALLRGVSLDQAEEWAANHLERDPLLEDFLAASRREKREAERQQREAKDQELARQRELKDAAEARVHAEMEAREQAEARLRVEEGSRRQAEASTLRTRWFSYALVCLLVLVTGAGSYARRQQSVAESRGLAARAETLLVQGDRGGALHLAIQAFERNPTTEAESAVTHTFPQLLAKLEGHSQTVFHAAFSPDSQRIVTASWDGTARIWNAANGQPLAKLRGHSKEVVHAAFSPDGQRIVTASRDGTARIWKASDGGLVAKLEGHSKQVVHAAFSPDGQRIATASWDGTARVWNTENGHPLAKLKGHSLGVVHVVFSPDGQRIVTASRDCTARVWKAADGQPVATLEGHSKAVVHAAFSPDGHRIVTASSDRTARVWIAVTGLPVAELGGHSNVVGHAAFSPDGRRIITASWDGTARVWNAANGQLVAKLEGHSNWIYHAAFSPNGELIITAGGDGTARVWNAANGRPVAELRGHSQAVAHAVFSPDGQRIVTASVDRTARVWNLFNGRTVAKLQGHSGQVVHGAFSADGQRIVTASWDDTARVWNGLSGQAGAKLESHTNWVVDADFSPDSQRVVTASYDGTAQVWNVSNGHPVAKLEGHSHWVYHTEFSPDGKRIVSASADGTARVWDATDGHPLAKLEGHSHWVVHAAFSPDGKRIVTASADGTARVWDATDGHPLAKLEGHSHWVVHAAFSPDGQRIVTASADGTGRVWNAIKGQPLATLKGHSSAVFYAAFSPDCERIVTASNDGTARIWNAANGDPMANLDGHSRAVVYAAFSPDGQRIVTASHDGTARVWNARDGQLALMFEGHSGPVVHAAFSPDSQRIVTASDDGTARVWKIVTLADITKMLNRK